MLAGAVIFFVLGCVFALLICCGFNQLRIAINVIDASADFLRKTKRVILVPVFYFFVNIAIVGVWIFCVACIWSIGKIVPDTSIIPQKKEVIHPEGHKNDYYYVALFMLFGLFWIIQFNQAKTAFIAMVSATSYYFDSNRERDGNASVCLGFKLAYMNHVGSLAFGSFIIALVQFIRVVILTIAEQAAKTHGENPLTRCILNCANCCLACIEKVCDYINQAAYAYMAVSGDNFCVSAWNGFLLNLKHVLKFAWANMLAAIFVFIGKIGLVVLNCFSLYMIMKHVTHDLTEISSLVGPMVIVAVITYLAATVILGLFDEVVLALMTCLAIDSDLNKDPKHGPPTFHDKVLNIYQDKGNQIQDGGWEKADANEMM